MKPRILIVEDDPGIADVLVYALNADGFEPHRFATGTEALAALAPLQPALVLLDIGLPDGNGLELFQRIRFYGQPLELSRYEYGLLRTLVARPGRVYSRDELLTLVWDQHAESLDRTVDAHVKTVRAKLKAVAPHVDPIRTHRGSGYALAEDLPPG